MYVYAERERDIYIYILILILILIYIYIYIYILIFISLSFPLSLLVWASPAFLLQVSLYSLFFLWLFHRIGIRVCPPRSPGWCRCLPVSCWRGRRSQWSEIFDKVYRGACSAHLIHGLTWGQEPPKLQVWASTIATEQARIGVAKPLGQLTEPVPQPLGTSHRFGSSWDADSCLLDFLGCWVRSCRHRATRCGQKKVYEHALPLDRRFGQARTKTKDASGNVPLGARARV